MTVQIANVKRHYKHEAEQAIEDLEARGYTVTYPLTNKIREGKTFMPGENRHVRFVDNVLTDCWMAQLKREVQVE